MDTLFIRIRRGRAGFVGTFLFLVAVGLGWMTVVVDDPGFSAGNGRRAAFLEGMPSALRAGFIAVCALACLYGAIALLRLSLRPDPSFAIRADGIADLRRSPEKLFRWEQIGGLTVDQNFLIA